MRSRSELPALPPRPFLPPSFFGALSALAVAALAMEAVWRAFGSWARTGVAAPSLAGALRALAPAEAAALVAAAGLAAAAHALGRRRGRARAASAALAWAAACAVLALLSCTFQLCVRCASYERLRGAGPSSIELSVRDDSSVSEYGVSFGAYAVLDGRRLACVQVSGTAQATRGSRLEGVFRISDLDGSEWGRSRFMRGAVAEVDAVRARPVASVAGNPVYHVRDVVLNRIDPASSASRALVAGTVCGYTTELNQESCSESFSRAGLTHLVAVSGSHLALIVGALELALSRLGARRPTVMAVVGAVMALYVVFTGGASSAIRSLAMVLASMATGLLGRRGHPLSGLSLTVVALVCADPGIAYDLGFQLSAASVLFISLFNRYIAWHARSLGLPRRLSEDLSLTLSAQWATVPLTSGVFGQVSYIAPAANLAVAPLMSAMLAVGVAVAPLSYLVPDSGWLFAPADWLARLSIFLASAFAAPAWAAGDVQGSAATVALVWGAAVAAYVAWARVPRAAIAAAVVCVAVCVGSTVLYWTRFAPPAVTVMDVGQADCILVRDGSSAMLVDAGEGGLAAQALARNHVGPIDAVVITHWHSDHYGGLDEVMASHDVGRVYVAEGMLDNVPDDAAAALAPLGRERLLELEAGDRLRVGSFECSVVLPTAPVEGDENEDSLCMRVSYERDGVSLDAFLTGDAEAPVTEGAAAAVGEVDLLKLGHHGSDISVSEALLDALEPALCVASAGEGNSYGHPDPACVALVEAAGATMLCTKDVGDVSVSPAQGGVEVRVARGAAQLSYNGSP